MIEIVPVQEKYFKSFHQTLDEVAQEKIFLEMVEAPPLEKVILFQSELIKNNGIGFYALDQDQVVGWCDLFPMANPRQNYRASLGMGLLSDYRGQKNGSRLLEKVLDQAFKSDLEKIELHVYTTNLNAIHLYKKFGFEEEGLIKKYRKVDHTYFDALMMSKFLI